VTRLVLAASAACGAGVAAYLTVVHFRGLAPICLNSGCDIVQRSRYAELAGIPVAAMGAATFVLLLASASVRTAAAIIGAAAVALTGIVFAAYLFYVQLAVLHTVCMWCIASDVLLVMAASAAALRLRPLLQ
jgi:uncharacterized membrane protein